MDKGDAIPEGISLELVIKNAGLIEGMRRRNLPDREIPKPKSDAGAARQKKSKSKSLFPEAKRFG
jgi:hypothetical protein